MKNIKFDGQITFRNNPIQATLRLMNSLTGKLIIEIETTLDGYYEYFLETNELIDVIVFNKTDLSIKPKIIRNVQP